MNYRYQYVVINHQETIRLAPRGKCLARGSYKGSLHHRRDLTVQGLLQQRFIQVIQDMTLRSDQFEVAFLESFLGQNFQVPHFGVLRKQQSLSRTTRERDMHLKHSKGRNETKKFQSQHPFTIESSEIQILNHAK